MAPLTDFGGAAAGGLTRRALVLGGWFGVLEGADAPNIDDLGEVRLQWCRSCRGARQMSRTAAHLVDPVLPHVQVRQWMQMLPCCGTYFSCLYSRSTGFFVATRSRGRTSPQSQVRSLDPTPSAQSTRRASTTASTDCGHSPAEVECLQPVCSCQRSALSMSCAAVPVMLLNAAIAPKNTPFSSAEVSRASTGPSVADAAMLERDLSRVDAAAMNDTVASDADA